MTSRNGVAQLLRFMWFVAAGAGTLVACASGRGTIRSVTSPASLGPGDPYTVCMPLPRGTVGTYGSTFLQSGYRRALIIDAVDPIGQYGPLIVDRARMSLVTPQMMSTSARQNPVGTAGTYPPRHQTLSSVADFVLDPLETSRTRAAIVFRVRWSHAASGRSSGGFGAVRVRYHVGKQAYETDITGSLRVQSPGPC